jgi:hypothetical protein
MYESSGFATCQFRMNLFSQTNPEDSLSELAVKFYRNSKRSEIHMGEVYLVVLFVLRHSGTAPKWKNVSGL